LQVDGWVATPHEQYQAFVTKFTPDLSTNAAELKTMAARKRLNIDVLKSPAGRQAVRPRVPNSAPGTSALSPGR
jgi:hypothetical protein